MLTVILLSCCLAGALGANPYEEFKSNFEYLSDTNLDEPAYRLVNTVLPTYVYVHLDTNVEEAKFDGFVQIIVNVTTELNQIVLHDNVVSIKEISVKNSRGEAVHLNSKLGFERDSYFEIIKLNFQQNISIGEYTIEISYLGQINENPFDRGFYRGYYYVNGVKQYYATTQFQPYHARKAFPCFDEPQFKAHYVISITRPESYSKSYSNMAIEREEGRGTGRIRETFRRTPLISSYLIAFHVSQFVETTGGTKDEPFAVIYRRGANNQHGYALDMGIKITKHMDDYFGIKYYGMGQGEPMKNDHIALPDFPSGAMENWGMVNYRESYLLHDPDNTPLTSKVFIATIIAHELTHKWFGNLVTCFWWSNLWLNEAFASYFEYFAAHGADKALELDDQFIVDNVHSALMWDAREGAPPMNWTEVVDNPSINSHFSTTSYAKGSAVLRMMEHFVGPDTFRKALQIYLRDNSYSLGTPEHMYNAFKQAVKEDNSLANFPNIDVGEVFDSYVQNPGAPVLKVKVDNDAGRIEVIQERYVFSANVPSTLWKIPITWTRGRQMNFNDQKPTLVLTTKNATIEKAKENEWVIFNVAQSSYYRVMYDDNNWNLIAQALKGNDREKINKFNRAQIANDVLVFLRGDHMNVKKVFEILEFLKYETDYYVWAGAIGQIDFVRRRLDQIPSLQKKYDEYVLEQMETVIEHLGFVEETTDSTSRILNRMQIMNMACNLGHEKCIEESKKMWNKFKNSPNDRVPVNSRRYVYCTGLRYGDGSDYDYLFRLYENSENTADMVVILRALGCTRNAQKLEHLLQQSVHNDLIRNHDKSNVVSYAVQGNPENMRVVLKFLENNYAAMRTHYGGSARLSAAISALESSLTDFEDILELQRWLYSDQKNIQDVFNTGRNVINNSIKNLRWGNSIAVDLHNYLTGAASGVIASITLLFTTVIFHLTR